MYSLFLFDTYTFRFVCGPISLLMLWFAVAYVLAFTANELGSFAAKVATCYLLLLLGRLVHSNWQFEFIFYEF
jgi:hypothetical protein